MADYEQENRFGTNDYAFTAHYRHWKNLLPPQQPAQNQFHYRQVHIGFHLFAVEAATACSVELILLRQVEVTFLLFQCVLEQ